MARALSALFCMAPVREARLVRIRIMTLLFFSAKSLTARRSSIVWRTWATDILYDSGECIHATPFGAGAYLERTPLMHEIREDGLDL